MRLFLLAFKELLIYLKTVQSNSRLLISMFLSAGHWRIFESQDPTRKYDDSHLIVMRELKEEDVLRKPGTTPSFNPFKTKTVYTLCLLRKWSTDKGQDYENNLN